MKTKTVKQSEPQKSCQTFFSCPYRYAMVFSLLLAAAFAFTLLDAFVIPKAMQSVPQSEHENGSSATDQEKDTEYAIQSVPIVTENAYKDSHIEISIETIRAFETDVYIADVRLDDASYLKTAFAGGTYGRNINEITSVIADAHNAIFAVNGDYYGFRDDGWVLRNGALYRSGGEDTALLMDQEGNLSCAGDSASIEKQIATLWQAWSFGPPLVVDGAVSVLENQEISGRASRSNPRTAIGQVDDLHYLLIVSDGRTEASDGLSLYELATLFQARGCFVAYNLDGGGSSTMVFDGKVVNNPTTGGKRVRERSVSDIVYIGYD